MELAINTSGRKKLVITKVLEKRKVKGQNGEFDVLDFLAKIEGEDTGTKYQVSYTALFEFIKLDTTIDCDVVVTEQKQIDPDGNPYRNRKITQIYQDGKPVKEQQQKKAWGKSSETVMLELDSKARNTALMQACEVAKGKQFGIPEILICADKFYAWLKGEKAPEKPVVKETPAPAQQEAALPIVDGQEGRPAMMPGSITNIPTSITNGTKLFSYVNKRGISLADFTATVQSSPNEVKTEAQLIAAWNVLAPKMKGK